MPNLTTLGAADLRAAHQDILHRYQAFAERKLKLNLTRGKPSSKQLDLSSELLTLPGADYLAGGVDTRNYGELQGLPELRAQLAPIFGVSSDRVIIGDNASLALMHDAVVYSLLKGTVDSDKPWSRESRVAFLCPVPGYDRHFSICAQFGIEMIPVPMLDTGPDMAVVEKLVAADPQIKGIWCVPKYSNPCGTVYSNETIERLAKMPTAARDFRLFWDNAYAVHHLTAERVEIANVDELCARHGNPNRAFIFGSTSKITLSIAGVSLFAGSKDNVAWYLKHMSMRTIGGDKVNQLRHIRFLNSNGGVNALMDRHRAILAPKFEAVLNIFDKVLGDSGIAKWTRPKGGYFISLEVLDGCAKQVVKLAKEAGVELTPAGATHPLAKDQHDRFIRIAPSFPELSEVTQAVEGVAVCVFLAATEKLLQSHAG
ncbi:aminotransferase class I/II-fold pyridoxal phosphate-dependent enzyme [Steroidobacter sp.]|uniref:aminotransferase class I/II-fold pyridoxal phosphate-dependent enzyme n=1 Tax=Steroidobacter sp. TaxID=1978227 RepID=UPI001A5E0158|nr:aminotransferase class I/II-fold pyridoxal phosphate-dependent enzyme [Steroidobacter sp.]MBL8270542.1 aminotransferase class I/II-fold pyridoxal phosphate-dependent enzyme [Steroidobacter sp.]